MKILIVEDDKQLGNMLKQGLVSQSHTVELSEDGKDGAFLGRSYEYDVIVLDYSLPKKNGLEVCKEIRDSGRTSPIIFLSVNDDSELKISALDAGADDYVTKPFSFSELYARLRAVSRRPRNIEKPNLQIEDLILKSDTQEVTRAGKPVRLTRKEFNLLEYFMKNQGAVLSRALIMEHVWTAESDPFSNTVEAHIRNVRRKLNEGGKRDLIKNIPGRGYIMSSAETLARF